MGEVCNRAVALVQLDVYLLRLEALQIRLARFDSGPRLQSHDCNVILPEW